MVIKYSFFSFYIYPISFDDLKEINFDNARYQDGCRLRSNTYYVRRETIEDKDGEFVIFSANLGYTFVLERDGSDTNDLQYRYENQLGYIKCSSAQGRNLHVNCNARGCGISTMLITFCLEDSSLNVVKNNDNVRSHVHKNLDPETATIMTNGCAKIYNELPIAPKDKAVALFNAALKPSVNYDKFLFVIEDNPTKRIRKYIWMHTSDAKKYYNTKTGYIKENKAWGNKWWVCQSIEGKFEKTLNKNCKKKKNCKNLISNK